MGMFFYWRRDDYVENMRSGPGFHHSRSQSHLHDIDLGHSRWGVTMTHDGRYVIAMELVAAAKTANPPGHSYGPYRVWGDPDRSRYFDVAEQSTAEPLLRSVSFHPTAQVLGQSFQGLGGLRNLTDDEERLREWCRDFPLHPTGRVASQGYMEARLHTFQQALAAEGKFDPASIVDARQRAITAIVRRRGQPEFRQRLIDAYQGRCAITGCDAVEALEAAHIIPHQGDQTNQRKPAA